MEEKVTENK